MQAANFHRGRGAILRDRRQAAQDKPGYRIIITVLRQVEIKFLRKFFYPHGTGYAPDTIPHNGQVLRLSRIKFIKYVTDNLFQQVFNRDNTGRSTVFINDNSQMLFLCLHILKQLVCMDAFRHKIGRTQQFFERARVGVLQVQQEIAGIKNTADIVDIFFINRVTAQAGFTNRLHNGLAVFIKRESRYFGFRRHRGAGSHVVEIKDVFNPFLFVLVNCPLFAAALNHHAQVFFACRVFFRFHLHAQQPQRAVGAQVQQNKHRCKDNADNLQDPQRRHSKKHGFLHCNALGNHFAKGYREEGDDDCNYNGGNHANDGGGQRQLEGVKQKGIQITGKVLGTESGRQEPGQRDCNLNTGQKGVGVLNNFQKRGGGFVPILRLLGKLDLRQR